MDIKAFLLQLDKFVSANSVIGFQSDEYPFLFVNRFFDFLKTKVSLNKVSLDLQSSQMEQIFAQLEMSFLGQSNLYWLGDLSELSLKLYMQWATYLAAYKGPHKLLFFTKKSVQSDNMLLVTLPSKVDIEQYKDIFLPLYSTSEQERVLLTIDAIISQVGPLDLDQAIRLTDYALVLGAGRQVFVDTWSHVIVRSESSLFNLSGAFFSKNKKEFLKRWKGINTDYEFPFWLAYFSEQFFRAYYYILYKKESNHLEAKKIGFRLPFSFLQRDWQKWDIQQLICLHQRVYELDGSLKNGGSLLTLDSLFSSILR